MKKPKLTVITGNREELEKRLALAIFSYSSECIRELLTKIDSSPEKPKLSPAKGCSRKLN